MKTVVFNIIRDDGYAKGIGIKERDVILSINSKPVTEPQQVTESIANGKCLFEIARGNSKLDFHVDSATLGVVLGEIDFDIDEFNDELAISSVVVSTSFSIPGKDTSNIIDIVGAEYVCGINALEDLAIAVKDISGGRSKTLEQRIRYARSYLCEQLRREAHVIGANAVVSVSFETSEIGDKGGYMLMMTATGMAVRSI